jgi:surface polysaccharide O-acyltransferase-like enzyme
MPAPATLGVYILHPLLIRFISSSFSLPAGVPPYIAVPALALIVFAWALVTVLALARIPYLRRLVGGKGSEFRK